MKRRTVLTGLSTLAVAGTAGCLGDSGTVEAQTDEEHADALRAEIDDRGVSVRSVELKEGVVWVEHGYDEPNDAVANVAMAFVERVADDWEVDRLEGRMRSSEGTDWGWHAKAKWAQAYADGEIGPEEYGKRIRETLAIVLESN